MARQRQRACVNTQGPLTLSRKDVIHLKGLERMTAGKHLFELRMQRGKFQEHFVEGAIADKIRWSALSTTRGSATVLSIALAHSRS